METAPTESGPCPNQKGYRCDLEADDNWIDRKEELHGQEYYQSSYHSNIGEDGCGFEQKCERQRPQVTLRYLISRGNAGPDYEQLSDGCFHKCASSLTSQS